MMLQMALSGGAVTAVMFFGIVWLSERRIAPAWEIAWRVGINMTTAILAVWALSGMEDWLRRTDEAVFWLIGIIWGAATLGAIYAPWFFITRER